ncbi:MAG: LPS-assembly protein LptD [Hyphomicrobiales bacterium]|nr:MAG: LPS-assembly protein LptD [Hyphomicrobiales bacterium]
MLLASAAVLVLTGATAFPGLGPQPAHAQTSALEKLVDSGDVASPEMFVEADELVYDFDGDAVSAVGNVQIYYGDYTLQADKVTLDRANGRLRASGGTRLVEPTGNVVEAEAVDLSDDFREGFIRSLRVRSIERTRFAAESAARTDAETTVFEKGIYTACDSCAEDPSRPPTWQIKAKKIIHKESEKMVYYEDPRIEFWGVPVAYLPFLSHPDPTVKRKTGLLVPSYVYSDELGVGVSIPYHWVLGPNMDLTFTATPLSRQGLLGQVEWRHRLLDGTYTIRAAGLKQADREAFAGTSGNRTYRGSLRTTGEFYFNPRWKWGWDATVMSDRAFLKDYTSEGDTGDEVISTVYLTGLGDRNFFDLRAYRFDVFQEEGTGQGSGIAPAAAFSPQWTDLQDKQPIVHPVLDYSMVFGNPVAGGELSLDFNLTSLTRTETDAFGINQNGTTLTRFRGVEGTFTRATVDTQWRRQFIDPLGQVFTPFASVQADAFFLSSVGNGVINHTANVSAINPNVEPFAEDGVYGRVMPAVGLEYRYPFISSHSWGSQVFEPIAQVVTRPDETSIGKLPNEDAQSLIFDDTTLFETDKFSGFDRTEGGTRANVGFQYKVQGRDGGFISALIGQSFHLAGRNSFATPDILNATANSGLEDNHSDYVARLYMDTNRGLQLGARARFDNVDFETNRVEAQAVTARGPFLGSFTYAYLKAQPDLGIPTDREEVQSALNTKLSDSWRVFGAIRYDIRNGAMVSDGLGIGYDDECFSMSLSFSEDRSRFDGDPTDRTVFFRLGLRTLGDTQLTTDTLN